MLVNLALIIELTLDLKAVNLLTDPVQTPFGLIHLLSDAFPLNLQETFTPKQYEIGTLHFERMFTSLHVLHVTEPSPSSFCLV